MIVQSNHTQVSADLAMDEGSVLPAPGLSSGPGPGLAQGWSNSAREFLLDIDLFVHELEPALWPLNCFLHDNPELGFQEHKAHDALTSFVEARKGWRVTRSAYGMETAWEAVYDGGLPGPVVSFNAEMGNVLPGSGPFKVECLKDWKLIHST